MKSLFVIGITLIAVTACSFGTSSKTLTTATPDLRVIKEDPYDFLLKAEDLPADAQYFLPSTDRLGSQNNDQVISDWGPEKGGEYIEQTGRIDGWWVMYDRGSQASTAPELIFSNVVMYESAEGAQLAVLEYNPASQTWRSGEYEEVDVGMDLGDISKALVSREMQPDGNERVFYRIEFAYRNYVGIVLGWGWEGEVEHEFIENAARTILDKLQAAPLSEP